MRADAPASYDTLRHRIHEAYDGLSPHLQRIAQRALDDPNAFALATVAELAGRCDVQPSTLIRFAKEFGYSGFSQMQKVFRVRLIEGAPAYRERIFEHKRQLEELSGDDPYAILQQFCEASALSLEQLRQTVNADDLRQAVSMLNDAEHIYVIGQRRAFPIASYFAYGLIRLEMRCQFLDFVGGMVLQQVATMRPGDLLVAVSFAEYAPSVVEVVRDAKIRGIPTLTITDVPSSPLAKYGSVCFLVDSADVHQFKPISGAIGLVQSLVIALSSLRSPAA
ncbi:MAG: MurR/RpiR family transcriptional regulator [Pseudomonadota bacterium]